ncbi:MAG TPA: hypothetical protein VJ325_01660 [Thiobacillus sp.]|nr:hypothetical protein [Thiobacillus sp.]
MNRTPALLACLLTAALLTACGGQPIQRHDGSSSVRSFSLKELAKGDVDTVVKIRRQEIFLPI